MFLGFVKVGGYNGLWEKYGDFMGKLYNFMNVINISINGIDLSSCFVLIFYWDYMFRLIDDFDYFWLGLWIILLIMGIWYWCID